MRIFLLLLSIMPFLNAIAGYSDCTYEPIALNNKNHQVAVLALCSAGYEGPNAWYSNIEILDYSSGKIIKSIELKLSKHDDEEDPAQVKSTIKDESSKLALQALSKDFESAKIQAFEFIKKDAVIKMESDYTFVYPYQLGDEKVSISLFVSKGKIKNSTFVIGKEKARKISWQSPMIAFSIEPAIDLYKIPSTKTYYGVLGGSWSGYFFVSNK